MNKVKTAKVLSLTVLLLLALDAGTGCQSLDAAFGGVARLPNAIDDVGEVIKGGIGKLEKESGNWRKTLEETRDKVIELEGKVVKDGQSTISNEINNVLQRAIAAAGAEARCSQEFIGDQVRRELEKLIEGTERDPTPLPPAVCQVIPTSVDLDISPSRRRLVEFYGYNLKVWEVSVFVLGGYTQQVPESRVSVIGNHTVTVSILPGTDGFRLNPASAQKLALFYKKSSTEREKVSEVLITASPCGKINQICCVEGVPCENTGNLVCSIGGSCVVPPPPPVDPGPMPAPCGGHNETPCKTGTGGLYCTNPSLVVVSDRIHPAQCRHMTFLSKEGDNCRRWGMEWMGQGVSVTAREPYEIGKDAPPQSFYVPGPTIDWKCWNSDEENWEKTACPGRTSYVTVSRVTKDGATSILCYDVN